MNNPKSFLEYYPNRMAKINGYAQYSQEGGHDTLLNLCYPEEPPVNSSNPQWYDDGKGLKPLERLQGFFLYGDCQRWQDWDKAGKNVFEFSAGILEMLSNTEALSINALDISLPYPTIYLDLSAANLILVEDKPDKIEGVYVRELNNYGRANFLDSVDNTWLKIGAIELSFVGNNTEYTRELNSKIHDWDCFGVFEYLIRSRSGGNEKVGEVLKEARMQFIRFLDDSLTQLEKIQMVLLYQSFIDRTASLVVNCLLYLMLPDKEVQQQQLRPDVPLALQKRLAKANTKAKRKAVEADIRGLGFTRVNLVGASIRPRAERAASTDTVAPHWRRGHWRNQRLGAGLQEQRLTWIKPVVVNKQLGQPAKGHIYNVQGGPASTTSPSPAAS